MKFSFGMFKKIPKEVKQYPPLQDSTSILYVDVMTGGQERYYQCMQDYISTTRFSSFVVRKHPSYIALLEMGPDIIPLLLNDLLGKKDAKEIYSANPASSTEIYGTNWAHFTLLGEIVGEESRPKIPAHARGRYTEIIKIWIEWGKERGLLDEKIVLRRFAKSA